MVVNWSGESPFVLELDRLIDGFIARHGKGVSVSLGDIWPAVEKLYPEGTFINTDDVQFRNFVRCRVLDQLRSDRRQSKRFGSLRDFAVDDPTSYRWNPSDEMIKNEEKARITATLDRLSELERALILAMSERRSSRMNEIARDLDVSRRTVKRHQRAACRRFIGIINQGESIGGLS